MQAAVCFPVQKHFLLSKTNVRNPAKGVWNPSLCFACGTDAPQKGNTPLRSQLRFSARKECFRAVVSNQTFFCDVSITNQISKQTSNSLVPKRRSFFVVWLFVFLETTVWACVFQSLFLDQKQPTRTNLRFALEDKPCRYKGSLFLFCR